MFQSSSFVPSQRLQSRLQQFSFALRVIFCAVLQAPFLSSPLAQDNSPNTERLVIKRLVTSCFQHVLGLNCSKGDLGQVSQKFLTMRAVTNGYRLPKEVGSSSLEGFKCRLEKHQSGFVQKKKRYCFGQHIALEDLLKSLLALYFHDSMNMFLKILAETVRKTGLQCILLTERNAQVYIQFYSNSDDFPVPGQDWRPGKVKQSKG